ncbi:hypothetical protein BaRGS_00030987, partial [Batillaria attramentaria]
WYKQVMRWGQQYRDAGIFRMWLLYKPIIGVTRAETAEVLLKSSKHMDKSSEYGYLHPWLGTGLLTRREGFTTVSCLIFPVPKDGELFRMSCSQDVQHGRQVADPPEAADADFSFPDPKRLVEVFNHQTDILMTKLEHKVDKGPFNIFQDIALCALDIICETAMGQHVSAQTKDSEYVRAVYRMCSLVEKRMRTPWHWNKAMYDMIGQGHEHDRCLKTLHEFTVKVIKDRMSTFDAEQARVALSGLDEAEQGDNVVKKNKVRLAFLDMLLFMAGDGSCLSVADIQEEVDTFMFEGHDTTAAAMNWCTYLIGSHPEVQDKIQQELDVVFGDSDRMATMKDLKDLKYLDCCIKEALRLYPSVPYFGRTTTEEAKLGSYTVPEGITTVIFTAAIHRDERWFPNPHEFDPDRFLPKNSTSRHPYAYIPFSAGLRNCIGQKFALLEEKAVLSALFRRFRVTTLQKVDELLPVGELILRPQNGVTVQLTSR